MKDDIKKVIKIVKIVKIVAACATIAMAVYTMIPKHDKIEGVTETGFIGNAESEMHNAE